MVTIRIKNIYRKIQRDMLIPLGSLALGIYWVIFLWNFWDRGVFVLGINYSIFFLLAFFLFTRAFGIEWKNNRKNYLWSIPIILIISGYAIYENPFNKITGILFLPFLALIFLNVHSNKAVENFTWSVAHLFELMFLKIVCIFVNIGKAMISIFGILDLKKEKKTFARILVGLLVLFIILVVIVLPLLSSSDPKFGVIVNSIYEQLRNTGFKIFFQKLGVVLLVSILSTATIFGGLSKIEFKGDKKENRSHDSIIAGIIVAGLSLVYFIFLAVQADSLWVSDLPSKFDEVETLVKTGFWQLIVLSVINIFIFIFLFLRTNKIVQIFLSVFTISSILLLISAGYRMFLYVYYYGFSYEKFYALYTVLFCVVLFAYLFFNLLKQKKSNIVKFLLFLFLWMYSITMIFPLEQSIIKINIRLATKENSRINIYESRILSADVLGFIEKNKNEPELNINNKDEDLYDWSVWIADKKKVIGDKKWYELNLSNIIYLSNK